MGYPDVSNPRHVRSLIDNVYAGYASGKDMFPRVRICRGSEELPRKTQPIAARLEYAWAVIDEDRAYFLKALGVAIDKVKASKSEQRSALVITCIGLNAINLAQINALPEPTVAISEWPREEFVRTFAGHEFGLASGGAVTLRNGKMEGPAEGMGMVARHSNVAGIFTGTPEETRELVAALGTTPVQTLDSLR